jgi:branched-chain amino acid transport system permease protein
MQFAFLLEQVVNGLVLGGYYLLIALGLSLIFSVGGIVNLAHGAFYALGAYASVEITKYLGFGPAIVLSPAAVALLGIVFERFILRRFYTADPILSLLVTFGLAMVAEQAIRIIWGSAPLSAAIPPAFRGSVFMGDFLFSRYRLLILAVVAAVLVGVWLLLHKTSFGRVVRAGIQRPDMVAALGIRLQPYMTAIVMLGVGLAALGAPSSRRSRSSIPRWEPKSSRSPLSWSSSAGSAVSGAWCWQRCWSEWCAASPFISCPPRAKPRSTS